VQLPEQREEIVEDEAWFGDGDGEREALVGLEQLDEVLRAVAHAQPA